MTFFRLTAMGKLPSGGLSHGLDRERTENRARGRSAGILRAVAKELLSMLT
jgi:hypothetical protein